MKWFFLRLNPEPWAIGPVGYARRQGKMSAYVGRNQQLAAFQEAVREELGEQEMLEGHLSLYFYFWRRQEEYKTPQARAHRKHEADATNLQKGLEDALQGVLYKNDKDNREVYSVIMAQGPDVEPGIGIGIAQYYEQPLPEALVALMNQQPYEPDEVTQVERDLGVPF